MKLLKEIADIRTGYPFRERAERVERDGVAIVQMRDIDGAIGWVKGKLDQVKSPPNWESHRLRSGDVLLAGRGERNPAAQFNDERDTVAASHLIVLRIRNAGLVTPAFLAWFLNHPQTQERLRTMRSGTNISFIPLVALERLAVPLPTIRQQTVVGELYQLGLHEQELLREIGVKRQGLLDETLLRVVEQSDWAGDVINEVMRGQEL